MTHNGKKWDFSNDDLNDEFLGMFLTSCQLSLSLQLNPCRS